MALGPMFRQYQYAILAYYIGGFLMAIGFGARVYFGGGSPITPEIYGSWVYAFPALLWVAIQAALAGFAAVFCALNRPIVSGVFGLALWAYLSVFAALALGAGAEGTILMMGAGLWLSPMCLLAAGISLMGGDFGR